MVGLTTPTPTVLLFATKIVLVSNSNVFVFLSFLAQVVGDQF